MTKVVDSALTNDISTELTPASDFFVQALGVQATGVFVVVSGKIEATADYVVLGSYEAADQPITKWSKVPYVKVGYNGNTAGQNVKIWVV